MTAAWAVKGVNLRKSNPKGKAKLLTFTRIYNLPWGFDQRYLTLGVAEFENGIKAMGQINADEKTPLQVGMFMEPSWETVRVQSGENVYGLKLTPLSA